MRRDVARQAGVGVLAPRAADAVGLLVNGEVILARFGELDRAEDARHPCADHRETQRSGCVHAPTIRHRPVLADEEARTGRAARVLTPRRWIRPLDAAVRSVRDASLRTPRR